MQLVIWLRSDRRERIWTLPSQQVQEIARCTPDPFPRRGVGSGDETTEYIDTEWSKTKIVSGGQKRVSGGSMVNGRSRMLTRVRGQALHVRGTLSTGGRVRYGRFHQHHHTHTHTLAHSNTQCTQS